jgi:16S rRNA (uracil1498-N3)-methyltransferase
MVMQRLAIAPNQIQNAQITLTAEQSHYLFRVLRLQNGDRFIALNGRGQAWIAQLQETTALLGESVVLDTELPVAVTLMVAMPKGSGFEEIVRSCTELGATRFQPLISDRVLLKPSPNKIQRWRRIAAEAAEQSERSIVPVVDEPLPLAAAIQAVQSASHRYICAARQENAPSLPRALSASADAIAIATGPEGGWTRAEIDLAIAAGFQPISLGKRILRAVTAPVAALSAIAAYYETPSGYFLEKK